MRAATNKVYAIPPEIKSVSGDLFDLYSVKFNSGPWDLSAAHALTLVFIGDLLTRTSTFDSKTNQPLFQPAADTYAAIRAYLDGGWEPPSMDGLMRQLKFVGPALAKILGSPDVGVFRRHESLPFGKAKKLDASCVAWLARQQGRTPAEKAAGARRIKCVKRFFSPNLHENKVTARVLKELEGALKTRRLLAGEGRENPRKEMSGSEPYSLSRWIGTAVAEDPFEGVVPSSSVTPNNRLLHDPHYNKVWRVWQWWRRRQEFLGRGWPLRWSTIVQVLVHATLAAIESRPGSEMAGNLLRPRFPESVNGGDFDPPYGYDGIFQAQPTPSPERTHYCDLDTAAMPVGTYALAVVDRAQGVEILRFSSRTECPEIMVSSTKIRAENGRPDVEKRHWHIHLGISHGDLKPERGLPLRARVTSGERARTSRIPFFMDRAGVAVFSRQLAEILCGPAVCNTRELAVIPRRQVSTVESRCDRLALDICGPDILAASGDSVLSINGAMAAVRLRLPEERGTLKWLTGDRATRFFAGSLGAENFYMHKIEPLLSRGSLSGKDSKDNAEALRNILSGLSGSLPKNAAGAPVAITVSDTVDPAGCAAFRRCLPPAWSRAWFVWRSVSAAMNWRATEDFRAAALEVGDGLLVIDGDSPLPSFTLLTARSEAAGPDPWYWERQPPRVIEPGAFTWSFNEILESVLAEIIQENLKRRSAELFSNSSDMEIRSTADGLVGRGLISSASRGSGNEFLLASLPEGSWDSGRLVIVDVEKAISLASDRFLTALEHHFSKWLENSNSCNPVSSNSAGMHVLLSGSPFGEPWLADRSRALVEKLCKGARAHVAGNAREASCRGALTFLARHAEGKPTWRDLLPSLHLKVAHSSELVEILPKSLAQYGVSPGEEIKHRVGTRFLLPRKNYQYKFPLIADHDTGLDSGVIALIEDHSFPLSEDLEVSLETRFHYAKDAYRIFIYPAQPKKTPFKRREIRWDRTSAGSVSIIIGRVQNEPPSFPQRVHWQEIWPPGTGALGLFDQVLDSYVQSIQPLCGAAVQQLAARAFKHQAARDKLLGQLKCAHEKLKMLEALVKEAWARSFDTTGGEGVEKTIRRMKNWLMVAAQMNPADGPVERLHKRLRTSRDPGIAKTVADLQNLARTALSRLREHTPPELPGMIFEKLPELREPEFQREIQALGRSLGFAEAGLRDGYLDVLLGEHAVMGDRASHPRLRYSLWALATAFWSAEDLVLSMDPPRSQLCLEMCRSLFARLLGEWKIESIGVSLFEEGCLILLGLLRRRGRPGGEGFQAGSPAMIELSEMIEKIDRSLQDQGRPPHGRLKFSPSSPSGTVSDLSQIAEELVANLCGTHASMIIALEERSS